MPSVHRDPVWVFAGVDPSGGAGLHQDLRVLAALGLEARGIPTSLTVQNVREVRRVFPVPPGLFCEMTDALREVETPAGIRVGLLPEPLFEPLSSFLSELSSHVPVFLDPIFRFGTGDPFLDAGVYRTLANRIFPHASLVIPNLPEASLLLGREVVPSEKEMREAAIEILSRYGPGAVYIKGGACAGRGKNRRVRFFTRKPVVVLSCRFASCPPRWWLHAGFPPAGMPADPGEGPVVFCCPPRTEHFPESAGMGSIPLRRRPPDAASRLSRLV